MFYAGSIQHLKRSLHDDFETPDLGPIQWALGMRVEFTPEGIYLSQKAYVNRILQRFEMEDTKAVSTPLEANVAL